MATIAGKLNIVGISIVLYLRYIVLFISKYKCLSSIGMFIKAITNE